MSGRMEELKAMERECRSIGRLLASQMPAGVGFFLAMYDFGESGWSTYMSNGQRADMIKYLRELAEHLETGRNTVDTSAGGSSEPEGGGR